MKVLLINPTFRGEKKHKHAPLGLYYIAEFIKDLADTEVFDCNVTCDDVSDLAEKMKPDIIGISVLTPTVNSSLALLRILKEKNRNCLFVAGGIHASSFPDDMIEAGFDLVIRGEGELTFYELTAKFGSSELYEIDGISFWDNAEKRVVHRKNRERIENLDMLGFPKLTPKELERYEYASIITSRGCAYQCYYCSSSYYWNRIVKLRSTESILSEIKYYLNLGVEHIYFCDDNFFSNSQAVKELCEGIIECNLNFMMRLDLIEEETLKLMKAAGCTCLSIGVECGSREVLRREKGISIDTLIEKFHFIQRAGIYTRTTWMIGMGKSYEEAQQSAELMKLLMPNQISIHMLMRSLLLRQKSTSFVKTKLVDFWPISITAKVRC